VAYIGQKPTDKPLSASDLEDGLITNAKLAQDIISGETELATAPADTDEFLISDAGVLKRLDASLVGGGGKLLQTALVTTSTAQTISSSTFADLTGMTVNITPVSQTSKFLIIAHINIGMNTASSGGGIDLGFNAKILRDSTEVVNNAVTNNQGSIYFLGASLVRHSFDTIIGYDDHNTTSQVTIKVQGREPESNSVTFNTNSAKNSYLLVQEIEQ